VTTRAVLCFLLRGNRVLLIRKRKGFGAGKLAGVGGRLEPGESPEEAAVREVAEEVGVRVRRLEGVGVLRFYSTLPEPDWIVYVFVSREFEGRPVPSDEAEPAWFRVDELPYDEMWEDDRVWLSYALAGRRVEGRFWFDGSYSRMLRWELTVRP